MRSFYHVNVTQKLQFNEAVKALNQARFHCEVAKVTLALAGVGTFGTHAEYTLLDKTARRLERAEDKLRRRLAVVNRHTPAVPRESVKTGVGQVRAAE